MGIKRKERRLSGRFYEDDPYDNVLLGKVDKMIKNREFKNLTELIRKGINLAYEDCYHGLENSSIDCMKLEVKYTADEISERILSQMDQRMEIHDAKILGAIAVGGNVAPAAGSDLDVDRNDVKVVTPKATGDLPEQTLSFLSNLNKD